MVCFHHIATLILGNLGNVLVPRTQSGAVRRTGRIRSNWMVQQIPSRTILLGRDCSSHFGRKSQAGLEIFIHYYNTCKVDVYLPLFTFVLPYLVFTRDINIRHSSVAPESGLTNLISFYALPRSREYT